MEITVKDMAKAMAKCREMLMSEYKKAIEEKNNAAYPTIEYIKARERANTMDTAILIFDLYTKGYLSAGD